MNKMTLDDRCNNMKTVYETRYDGDNKLLALSQINPAVGEAGKMTYEVTREEGGKVSSVLWKRPNNSTAAEFIATYDENDRIILIEKNKAAK